MKNNTHKILLGLSMLGATTLIGFSTPASAKPNKDVKEARKELKQARKEVRRADTPEERRDAREDLREERRDYREEVRENRNNNGRRPYGRPSTGPGSFGYRPGSNYNRPTYNRPNTNNNRTLEGVVTRDLSGNDFLLRLYNGQTVRVYAVNGESGSISGGDTVRVTGTYSGSGFRANRISILNNR